MSAVTHSINLPPRFSADLEQQVLRELIEMGYGRFSIAERDLPGLHFPKALHVGPGHIKFFSGSRAKVGSNLFAIPIPRRNENGKWSVQSRRNILLQSIYIREADRREGSLTVHDPWTHEPYELEVVLDPHGPDLRARFVENIHQAILSAEVARSRSPLRRFARAIGF